MTFQGQQQKPRQKGYRLVQQQDHRSLALKVSYANDRKSILINSRLEFYILLFECDLYILNIMVKLELPSLLFVRDSNYNTCREKIVNFACLT
jgi:hypothetical protein